MAIIRGQIDFSAHFTQVPNEWVRDANLSHRARGVLLVLMSHRSGWEVTTEHLIRNGTEGRDAIRTAIRELVDQGYLQREQVRDEDSARASGSRYVLTGKPLSDGFPGAQKSDMGGSGFSGAQKPVAQKSATKNTNSKKTKGQEDQEKSAPDGDAPAKRARKSATAYSAAFLDWWEHYPRRADKGSAWKAWQKIKGTPLETLIAGADRYAADPNREPRYTKLPATWLNARAWEDETPLPAKTRTTGNDRVQAGLALAQRLRAQEGGHRELETG